MDMKLSDFLSLNREISNNRFIKPHIFLEPYIAHYNIAFPDKVMSIEDELTLIPDASGCIVLTFDREKLDIYLWGPTTKIVNVSRHNNYLVRFFIEFLPAGFSNFISLNQNEITDLILPLEQVDKRLYELIFAAFEQAWNANELFQNINGIFLSMLNNKPVHNTLISSLKIIRGSLGTIPIKKLSAMEHYSERHINRIFNENIGMNVKTFAKLLRINNAIKFINSESNFKIKQVAQEFGFFDEAHFINDFKSICGVSPRTYCRNMSDFYNEQYKF